MSVGLILVIAGGVCGVLGLVDEPRAARWASIGVLLLALSLVI
jgi:hypothetical protein